MRAARFECSIELLRDLMQMPAASRIVQAQMSRSGLSVEFVVDDASLPEAPDPHLTIPTVTKESLRWDWGVPS